MKILFSLVLNILICFSAFAQFTIEINSSLPHSCQDSTVKFTASATSGGTPVNNVDFSWSFGDNSTIETGIDLDTVDHKFINGGGHLIRLDASWGAEKDYVILNFETALTPNFSGTVSSNEGPICLGQEVLLTGKIADSTWIYQNPDLLNESVPELFSNSSFYYSDHDYRIFAENQIINSDSDIDTIAIKLEHSNLTQVKIELICPDGNSIILKDFGGPVKYFGEPVLGANPDLPGTGYFYYFTNSPTYGTINSSTPAGSSLPSGSYQPEQPFSLLNGCPLNGIWTLKISDNQLPDSGFVFADMVKFNASILPPEWKIKHTYSFPKWIGNGVSSTSGSGLAAAVPTGRENYGYTYRVKDNFGCTQDTIITVRVEPVTFTADPTEGDFDLDVSFESTTSWAVDFNWSFDDDTNEGIGETVSHIYTIDGDFWVQLTAEAEDGCSDTSERMLIRVTIPESNFQKMQNWFIPSSDNEKIRYFRVSESDLEGIQTIDCWIYSRWGKKMDEWHSIDDAKLGWDGRFDGGQEATPGVYYYVLKAKGFDGKEYKLNSFVHLFR
ncbi:MAG: PKD domain-containing protein [Bacteroidales bacterium]